MHKVILRKFRDTQKDENRFQVMWASDRRVIHDSAYPGDTLAFLLGLCSYEDGNQIVVEDEVTAPLFSLEKRV